MTALSKEQLVDLHDAAAYFHKEQLAERVLLSFEKGGGSRIALGQYERYEAAIRAALSPAPAVTWVEDTWRIRQQEASRVLKAAGWGATAIRELFEPYAAPARETTATHTQRDV